MVDLLNACMRDEMERDPRIVVFGEDVADCSREESLEQVKGKGGVFKVTYGLQRRFGSVRVFNSPLAEANIVGRAVGMATRGLKPVVEIQFFDYIWPAMMQIRDELATMRYRSGGSWKSPVVIRVAYGGYLKGGGIYHSQTGETLFTHTPGLRVVLPSNALDANGLLRTAIRCDDPGHLPRAQAPVPPGLQQGPLSRPGLHDSVRQGEGRARGHGSDGRHVRRAGEALAGCGAPGAGARHQRRSDRSALAAAARHGDDYESVKKTNKVIVAHEDSLSWGIGSEIAARIADELFAWLDGPVRRVASLDTWVAYSPELEDVILPQTDNVLKAIEDLHRY